MADAAPAFEPHLLAAMFEALVEAAAIVRLGSNAHVMLDEDGTPFASPIIPVRSERREWLRVRIDGVVEDATTGRKLGTLAELGVAGAPRSALVELATISNPAPAPRPRRIRKATPR